MRTASEKGEEDGTQGMETPRFASGKNGPIFPPLGKSRWANRKGAGGNEGLAPMRNGLEI